MNRKSIIIISLLKNKTSEVEHITEDRLWLALQQDVAKNKKKKREREQITMRKGNKISVENIRKNGIENFECLCYNIAVNSECAFIVYRPNKRIISIRLFQICKASIQLNPVQSFRKYAAENWSLTLQHCCLNYFARPLDYIKKCNFKSLHIRRSINKSLGSRLLFVT